MKKLLILVCFLTIIFSCKAQIVALENFKDYKLMVEEIPDGTYIKDINNVLGKFTGVWKGIYNNENYEFIISKITENFLGISEDVLLMKYKITDSNGTIIESTLTLPNNNYLVTKGGS